MIRNKFTLAGFLLLLFTLAACQPSTTAEVAEEPTINTILVLPTGIPEQPRHDIPSEKSRELEKGAQALNAMLSDYFTDKPTVRLLSEVPAENLSAAEAKSPAAMARAIGHQQGGDAVLFVTLTRYTERHGNDYDVVHPASVAFELKLIDATTGKTLWLGAYDKTQESLSENLLTLKDALRRHFTWVTVEELARDGIQEKLATCKYLAPPKS